MKEAPFDPSRPRGARASSRRSLECIRLRFGSEDRTISRDHKSVGRQPSSLNCALNCVTHNPQGDAPHALVVDDDALILMEATGILEDAGFRVLEAINVVQALRILNQHHDAIELLFTDVHMPGNADGFDLARQTTERWPHIGVVVASGQAEPGPGDLPDGATFIGKPFSAEIVRHHVRKTLPDARHPKQLRT